MPFIVKYKNIGNNKQIMLLLYSMYEDGDNLIWMECDIKNHNPFQDINCVCKLLSTKMNFPQYIISRAKYGNNIKKCCKMRHVAKKVEHLQRIARFGEIKLNFPGDIRIFTVSF